MFSNYQFFIKTFLILRSMTLLMGNLMDIRCMRHFGRELRQTDFIFIIIISFMKQSIETNPYSNKQKQENQFPSFLKTRTKGVHFENKKQLNNYLEESNRCLQKQDEGKNQRAKKRTRSQSIAFSLNSSKIKKMSLFNSSDYHFDGSRKTDKGSVSWKNENKSLAEKQHSFKDKIAKYRIDNLVKHFISKVKRITSLKNTLQNTPVLVSEIQESEHNNIFQINQNLLFAFLAIGAIFTIINCLISTLLLIFQAEIKSQQNFLTFQYLFLVWAIIDIVVGILKVRQSVNQKFQKTEQIIKKHVLREFIVDFMYLMCCFFLMLDNMNHFHKFFYVFLLIKLYNAINRLHFFEDSLANSFYSKKYFAVGKILAKNLLFAHSVAIVMILMSLMNENSNWEQIKGISNSIWYEKYCWAYYWATTTMLSVGFGDIVPANYKQAIFLILIQVISCMSLAYNINCIGSLLNQIRQKQAQKQKKLKLVKKLCDKNLIQHDLELKINNHIKQSTKMEERLNFNQNKQLLAQLPEYLKLSFSRQSNLQIINKITFLQNFTQKTIQKIAQKLIQKMLHPWELAIDSSSRDFVLLKQGHIGLCPNFNKQKYGHNVINKFIVQQKQTAALISMDFVKVDHLIKNYDVKSVGYSIISFLSYDTFLDILKLKNVDNQFFYSYRDKQRKNYEDLELLQCQQCKSYHSKFVCPRLHYRPILQHLVYKHLYLVKNSKTIRRQAFTRSKPKIKPLKIFKETLDVLFTNTISDKMSLFLGRTQKSIRRIIDNENQTYSENKILDKSCYKSQMKLYIGGLTEDLKEMIQKSKCNFTFWTVESDLAYNYQFYFAKENPKCLSGMKMKSAFKRSATIKTKKQTEIEEFAI